MTENKRFEFKFNDKEYVYFYIIDNKTGKKYKYLIDDELLKLLNELHEENQSIKKHIQELYKYIKIDVDNEREVYPKTILEGIVDILKIISDIE